VGRTKGTINKFRNSTVEAGRNEIRAKYACSVVRQLEGYIHTMYMAYKNPGAVTSETAEYIEKIMLATKTLHESLVAPIVPGESRDNGGQLWQ